MKNVPQTTSITELLEPKVVSGYFEVFPEAALLPFKKRIERLRVDGVNTQTEFFRDEQVLGAFAEIILPSFPQGRVVRIASVGCSIGKEPYSFLVGNWKSRDRLRIDAYDVNPQTIDEAVKGEYGVMNSLDGDLKAFEDLGLANPAEVYSVTEGWSPHYKKLKFSEDVRARIKFQVHDMAREPLPQKHDVVLLLNVLMHYAPKGREAILANLHKSIETGGWLVCERAPWMDPEPERMAYGEWMRHIGRLGFRKQRIVLPGYFFEDQTPFSQIYRKTERRAAR